MSPSTRCNSKSTDAVDDPWDCKICKTIFAESDAKLLECQRCKEHFCIKCLKNQIQSMIYYQSQTQCGSVLSVGK